MDQADSLRSLFAKQSAREKLIQCRDKLRSAIKMGNYEEVQLLTEELEHALLHFEASLEDDARDLP